MFLRYRFSTARLDRRVRLIADRDGIHADQVRSSMFTSVPFSRTHLALHRDFFTCPPSGASSTTRPPSRPSRPGGRPVLRPLGARDYIMSRYLPPVRHRRVCGSERPSLVSVSVRRHTESLGRALILASMNVRSSSPLKLDGLLVEQIDRSLHVIFTSSDMARPGFGLHPSSACRRLRRYRGCKAPSTSEASLGINHARWGRHRHRRKCRLTPDGCQHRRSTVNVRMCRRPRRVPPIDLSRYRACTGSVTANFFDDLLEHVLDRPSTHVDPIIL